jgi:predicted metalloprotease
MRWQNRRQSTNVEDRRRLSGRGLTVGGGLGAVVLAVLYLLFGGKASDISQGIQSFRGSETSSVKTLSPAEKEMGDFAAVILADTEDVWHMLFRKEGLQYSEPRLVLFSNATESACGYAQSATGPFYCPGDRIYRS